MMSDRLMDIVSTIRNMIYHPQRYLVAGFGTIFENMIKL